ncbi:MAG: hypothetical protein ABR941_11480 [Thermoleophilia bacterium]
MRMPTRTWAGRAALAACLLALPVVVAACGSKSTAATATPSPTPSTATSASPTAAITTAWQTFFSGTTPAATKITLLQDGQKFATVIQEQAGSPLAKATQAKVTAVTVTSPTTADVTYSILQGGQVALPDQKGQAVLEGGVWKVSAPSFQALLKLEQGQASASPSATP